VTQGETRQPSHATGRAAEVAGWSHGHRDVSGGWLRPTVFGAVDGLVTNASLISGLGGGGASSHVVVLTGVAALVAGAFSMGTGEYISVTNQNELVHSEVALESQMHARFPDAERDELAGYFRNYGADPGTATRMAAAVSADPGTALRIHTREELGIDPDELPSPILAGVASLLAFSLGALALPSRPALPGRDPGSHGGSPDHRRDGRRAAHRTAGSAIGPAASRAGRSGGRGDLRRWLPDRQPRGLTCELLLRSQVRERPWA
jgi:VIT1/CCC1 family predicted Fe2+/Mn2+ transporter